MRTHRPLVRLTGALLWPSPRVGRVRQRRLAAAASAGTAGDDGTAAGEDFVIRFADPGNHGIIAYAKANGSFDEPLAEVGATIEWVPAAGAFSANFDLLQSGEINTHQAAVSPIIGAVSNGLDVPDLLDQRSGRRDGRRHRRHARQRHHVGRGPRGAPGRRQRQGPRRVAAAAGAHRGRGRPRHRRARADPAAGCRRRLRLGRDRRLGHLRVVLRHGRRRAAGSR